MNKIVTRGMGPSRGAAGRASLVTQGYGGIFQQIVSAVQTAYRRIVVGGRRQKREEQTVENIAIHMKLIRVNDEKPETNISGGVRTKFDLTRGYAVSVYDNLSVATKRAWKNVKIIVKRFM